MSSIIKEVLLEEYKRINRNLEIYTNKLSKYPKGSLIIKKRQNHLVYYLNYRENNKVISKYIKKSDLASIMKQIEKRNILITQIKALKLENKEIMTLLKIKKKGK